MRSDDGGQAWQRSTVAISEAETDFALLGVSPTNPDLVVGMAESADPLNQPERLFVSRDGGHTFDSPMTLKVINSVNWSADGKNLWIAADEGLYRSTDDGKTFGRVGVAEYLSCVIERPGLILVCGWYRGIPAGNPGIGVSTDGGETFERYMSLSDVAKPLRCDAAAATSKTCAAPWVDWERELLGAPITVDAGVPPPGAGSGVGSAGVPAAGSGGTPAAGSGGAPSAGQPSVGGTGSDGSSTQASDGGGCSVGSGPGSARQAPTVSLGCLALAWFRRRRR
jgi:hypothetical protein